MIGDLTHTHLTVRLQVQKGKGQEETRRKKRARLRADPHVCSAVYVSHAVLCPVVSIESEVSTPTASTPTASDSYV